MATNAFLHANEYANVMLALVKNNLVMGRLISGRFEDKLTNENGLRINVKRPPMFIVKDGPTLQKQSIVTGSTDISVTEYKNVHIGLTDLETVQSWNQLMKNETMKAAASAIAHHLDLAIAREFLGFYSHVGTFGQSVKTPQQANKAHVRLMDQSVPNESLSGVVTFEDGAEIRGTLLGGNIDDINKSALQRLRIPMISEINWYATNNILTHTTGTRAVDSEATVDGNNQNNDYRDVKDSDYVTLVIADAGTKTFKRGDIFTIGTQGGSGVYAINRASKQQLPYLQQFVVMEDATAVAGAATLKIWPPMIVAGTGGTAEIRDENSAFATVSHAPVNDMPLTFIGAPSTTDVVRAVFHKQAIELVSARLPTPFSDTHSFVSDPETGISIRYWRGSDINTGTHAHRWDLIYGVKNIEPRLGVRLSGASS